MRHGRPLIGISASFMHADPQRALFKGKTLLFAEESLLHWVMSGSVIPVLLPTVGGALFAEDIVNEIDGLVLQGGADMSPRSYGEEPLRPEWQGDYLRDVYEMELVRLCLEHRKPILGVCRGTQVLNVALGGSLYQDIETLHPAKQVHRNWDVYDKHVHEVAFEPGSSLARWYSERAKSGVAQVNSVHHQGIKTLGRDLVIEARSVPDGVIEAVRYAPQAGAHKAAGAAQEDSVEPAPFAFGVQWHPEFMQMGHPDLLDPGILLQAFLVEVTARASAGPRPAAPGGDAVPASALKSA